MSVGIGSCVAFPYFLLQLEWAVLYFLLDPFVFLQLFIDLSLHQDVEPLFVVIQSEGDAAVQLAGPIIQNVVFLC